MKIVNLLKTTLPFCHDNIIDDVYIQKFEELGHPHYNLMFKRFRNTEWNDNYKVLLNECPVFIVETSMAGQTEELPTGDMAVKVPFPMKEGANKEVVSEYKIEEGGPQPMVFDDILGVYIYTPDALLEHKIFVWADRIKQATDGNADNTETLFQQVILHEQAHFLQNPYTYNDNIGAAYSYVVRYYKGIEESCANALSLALIYDTLKPHQQVFIENFIKAQPEEYADGWEIYEEGDAEDVINGWLQVKVLKDKEASGKLCHDIECMIKFTAPAYQTYLRILYGKNLYWDYSMQFKEPKLHNYVKRISPREAVFSEDGKLWGIMDSNGEILVNPNYDEIETAGKIRGERVFAIKKNGKFAVVTLNKALTGFIYDSVWSFQDNEYCQVAIDNNYERKYGLIDTEGNEMLKVVWDHLYNFDDSGLTPAKLEGVYHIINKKGEIVVPNLPFVDVRAFVNGYAFVKGSNDKWGLMDTSGKLAVDLLYDKLNEIPEP